MKFLPLEIRSLILLGLLCVTVAPAFAEPAPAAKRPVMVIVHGAWGGGWQFRKVAPLLEARGFQVYRPSLTGLGEHSNLASPAIGLETHVSDIVNLILFEDLHDVILVGHSYGGMVITGVADRLPERISRLVYLDAFLPEEGDSVMSLRKPGGMPFETLVKDGFIPPWWVKPDKPYPKDVPQPYKTFTDPIALRNPAARKIPGTFILTVEKGHAAQDADFAAQAARARSRGWPVLQMESNHNPEWFQPEATAEILAGIH